MHASQNEAPGTPHTMASQNIPIMPISTAGAPGAVPGPTTNLNIGMDYWGAPASSGIPALRGKVPSTAVAGAMVTGGSRDSVQPQLWLQVKFGNGVMISISLLKCNGCKCLFFVLNFVNMQLILRLNFMTLVYWL